MTSSELHESDDSNTRLTIRVLIISCQRMFTSVVATILASSYLVYPSVGSAGEFGLMERPKK